jgi:O-antigen/teichoic acid export membrane protein
MLVLLPILAARVAPEQYAQVTVAATVAAIAAIFMGLGLETPLFRTWFATRDDPPARRAAQQTAFTLMLISSGSAFLVFAIGAVLFNTVSDAWSPALIVLALAGAIGQTLIRGYALPLLRANDRRRAYLLVQVAGTIAHPLLVGLLVVVIPLGSLGWVMGATLAQVAGVVVAARFLRDTVSLDMDHQARKQLLGLGLPLIPHAAAQWTLSASDRLILAVLVPAASVGVYGMAYAAGAVVAMALTEFNRALMNEYGRHVPTVSADGRARRETERSLGPLIELQVIVTAVVTFVAAVLGPPIFEWVFPESYAVGADLLPLIVLGSGLFGLYYIPVDLLVLIEGRTRLLGLATWAGATANVIANLALIPRVGILGAAQATVIGYSVMLTAVSYYAFKTAVVRPRLRLGPAAFVLVVASLWAVMEFLGASRLNREVMGAVATICVTVSGWFLSWRAISAMQIEGRVVDNQQ